MPSSKNKILLADDEKDILDIYQEKLAMSGYEVISTEQGAKVLSLALKHQPDLILLDIMMPDIDGYQVIKALKDNIKTKKIPVIMLSNLGHGDAIQKGIMTGADDYIVKVNYTPQELVEKVSIFFKNKK